MIINIHGEIKNDAEKTFELAWFGADTGISYKDIDEALASKSSDDKEITLKIHCNGGNCIEGFAIYDKLRSVPETVITAEVEGECSSMATIILLAASVRKAYPDSRVCIHKPRFMYYSNVDVTEDVAMKLYQDLHDETERVMKIYEDRTGCDRVKLESLMKEDKYITPEEAQELGFITEIISHVSAKKSNNINMEKKKLSAMQTLVAKIAKAAGVTGEDIEGSTEEGGIVAMTLNSDDGTAIEIEREDGDPQVGDSASPDGEFKMPDGKTIVIKDGVITEIKPKEEEETQDDAELEKANKRIAELEEQLKEAQSGVKTQSEKEILNLVAMAGGREWLLKAKSEYVPASRKSDTTKSDIHVSKTKKELEELKAKMKGE